MLSYFRAGHLPFIHSLHHPRNLSLLNALSHSFTSTNQLTQTHTPTGSFPRTQSLTHFLTHSLTHQLPMHSLTYPPTHSLTQIPAHSPIHTLTHPPTTPNHAFTRSPAPHALTHLPTHSHTHSLIHTLTHIDDLFAHHVRKGYYRCAMACTRELKGQSCGHPCRRHGD